MITRQLLLALPCNCDNPHAPSSPHRSLGSSHEGYGQDKTRYEDKTKYEDKTRYEDKGKYGDKTRHEDRGKYEDKTK